MYWLWLGTIAAGILLAIAWLHGHAPGSLSSRDNQIGLVHGLLVLAFVGASLFARGRVDMKRRIRDALLWMAIGGLILTGYTFRDEARWLGRRLIAEVNPSGGTATRESVSFRASRGGHFIVDAVVEGETVRFLVDTGASDVVLSPNDARRIGLDPSQMAFTRFYHTANGIVSGAPVRLGYVALGPIRLDDVRASVNGADLDHSLLGMSFLERLPGFDVNGTVLTLHR